MSGPFAIAELTKYMLLTPPAVLVDGASLTVAELDTLGFDHAEIILTIGATDIGVTAMILTDGDTSGSGHANITTSNFDGQTNAVGATAVLPSATDDDGFFVWSVDLRKRKRYIDMTITVGDGTVGGYYSVMAILSNAKEAPVTEAERGVKDWIRI